MELPATSLSLPRALPFPITVQRIHSPVGTTVQKTATLLTYSFVPALPDEDGNRVRQVRQWESPIAGDVVQWAVRAGDLVRDNSQPIVHIKEPCTHDVQLQGLCALCGKDLTTVDYTGFSDTSRATISMVHDVGGLTVSLDEAHRLESATTNRLLGAKKLSLIVDLDQTIVHATVEPTVWEWMQDPKNPNYSALEGVKRFKLSDESPASTSSRRKRDREGRRAAAAARTSEGGDEADDESSEDDDDADGCWYYIKMRPGLPDFLKRVSEIYEMHVYTMGTRAYAKEVCKVIDPDGGLFGGRILSRDESGSLTRKSLQRLFPCDTNMVVIIDDRADVWDGSPHLVKVIPYEFFVGIGDINAAFLPKKKELVPPPSSAPPPPVAAATTAQSIAPSSSPSPDPSEPSRTTRTTTPTDSPPPHAPLHLPDAIASEPTTVSDLLVEPSSSTDIDVVVAPALAEASSAAQHAIHDVIEARPLEKAAREAHEAHERHVAAGGSHEPSPVAGEQSATPPEVGEVEEEAALGEGEGLEDEDEWEEEAVLKDDDRELDRVYEILSTVRDRFFEEHEARGSADVASIIPSLKRLTLASTRLVFSGLVALGQSPESSEYWKLATTFGAHCSTDLSSATTHLVANQEGTAKVHQARRARAKGAKVEIVYPQWLLDSVARWTRLPEEAYLLPEPAADGSAPGSPVHPELSAGEDNGLADAPAAGGPDDTAADPALDAPDDDDDLHLDDLDWGDAMKEVDDLLLETDDDDTASLLGGGDGAGGGATDGESDASAAPTPENGGSGSAAGAARSPRKRPRASSPGGASAGGGGRDDAAHASSPSRPTESPLQKRVKTARSRRSGLKQSLISPTLTT
ncbi:uncharacterized protein RHOBADRAFT_55955 [Rhodotorula graminis WP1]|uniref:RNA polymerase II subunit A C-terminal domain phosphatase n=1 Tax=Rhodotorula graminis (strain WP1) TaxID=578459 RepID=A0A0P9F907_RHOGW|nr:uncharacterized protein RHOBADRAFT_55955 [Rhodotorula graminis WP1]KPV72112.1 hypothetical protein RHOBADRAFT_55955 [Rhodotorula graminis WP1]